MNTARLQKEVITELAKDGFNRMCYATDEDYVYITTDGYRCFRIRLEDWFIDLKKIKEDEAPMVKNMLMNFTGNSAERTNDLRVLPNDKRTVVRITDGTIDRWLDTKLLKMFEEKSINLTYEVSEDTQVVRILDCGEVIGLQMPVRMDK